MDRKIPYYRMSKIRFSAYSSEEIFKLSVLEVTNPETMDILGHPSKGGLHDPALGPNSNSELCSTCSLNQMSCPGHVGHIKLPLPVYNPFFFQTLYKLLKGSCFQCHRLLAPEAAGHLLLAQLQALDHGLVGLAQELEQLTVDVENEEKAIQNLVLIDKLSKAVQFALNNINCEDAIKTAQVKNVVDCKQKTLRKFIKEHLSSGSRKCCKCHASQQTLSMYNNSKIVFTSKAKDYSSQKKTKSRVTDVESFDDIVINEENEDEDDENLSMQNFLSPSNARVHLRKLWENEKTLLQRLYGSVCNNSESSENPVNVFFLDVVPVPPIRFRPMNYINGLTSEGPQTANLKEVLKYSIVVRSLIDSIKSSNKTPSKSTSIEHIKLMIDKLYGKNLNEKLNTAWLKLQTAANCVLDCDLDKFSKLTYPGVKQLLEKKEGLFRKNMMGKRVNYAARSVISPDPFIKVNEIGIPHVFATKLTYPQPVTAWNVEELKHMVINGPDVYPGATIVKNEDGSSVKLNPDNTKQREAVAKQLLTPSNTLEKGGCLKIVHRHLKNGDVLLLNRQPTLHKPSIMAHKARILPGEKTLRLHYANCKTYNADFDGDEMNAHFPQSEHGRAEAYTLMLVDHQYLVPKDGTPLSGLIQDHVISGCLMSIRGKFFNRIDYQELVYAALTFKNSKIKTLPPAILKPERLWSGKQIISTVIINVIPENKPLINLVGKSKVSMKNWNNQPKRQWLSGGSELKDMELSESEVIFRSGELLCGILDKAHYGSSQYGLVHCCNELYGGATSVLLLTSFSRLFTIFLQYHGFTLGVEDILVVPKANRKRLRLMKTSTKVGDDYAARAMNCQTQLEKELLTEKLCEAHYSRNDFKSKQLDMVMKEATDKYNNAINKVCLPAGLLKKFPHNNLQLMVESGAKGSTVNTMQISGLLGQIELEGRRPPLMISGKSLPSFVKHDTSPRAGGFITGRFLSGIRPQEYFFHCMAGREGLVDTAVKTSRSGYLQRCLIKHLEGIMVNYDLTVRDSDGSVIQFLYGDDGLDIPKTQFLKSSQMSFLKDNMDAVADSEQFDILKSMSKSKRIEKLKKKIKKSKSSGNTKYYSSSYGFTLFSRNARSNAGDDQKMNFKTGRTVVAEEICDNWRKLDVDTKASFNMKRSGCPNPVVNEYQPNRNFASISESIDGLIQSYVEKSADVPDFDPEKFRDIMYFKTMRSLCEPGEAVGLLAAQSVGEPSTQMTLNTFHFAGRGEMNVTLGIPRLREILMVASANIATPSMVVPLLPNKNQEADELRLQMNKVHLKELLQNVSIKETLHVKISTQKYRKYKLKFKFLPHKLYKDKYFTNPPKNLNFMETMFFTMVCAAIKRKIAIIAESKFVSSGSTRRMANFGKENDDAPEAKKSADDGESSDDDQNEGDTTSAKQKSRHDQEQEYDEPEENEAHSEVSDDEDEEVTVKTEPMDEDEDVEDQPTIAAKTVDEKWKEQRVHDVLLSHHWIVAYDYDINKEEWCEITLKFDLEKSKLDLASIIEEEAGKAIVHEVPNINKAILSPLDEPNPKLTVDGINIQELFKYGHIVDLNKLYSNHIHAIAKSYGIEAARSVIVNEIVNVFAVYGIQVDLRHLSLIADYMTFEGSYKPFNRIGMESHSSPIQQMTFETTLQFLKSAALLGYEDQLKSPSSRIVVGKIVNGGTGSFELLQKPYNAESLSYEPSKYFSKTQTS